MFGRGQPEAKPEPTEKRCRCEATIAPVVLDGFSCGRPDCWRTAAVQAAQDHFVAELIRRREAVDGADV